MSRPILTAALASAALLGASATADASTNRLPNPIPVPAGQLQHTVTEFTFTSNITSVNSARRTERWVTDSAARSVVTDPKTGALLNECASTTTATTCYSAEDGKTETMDDHGTGLRSWAYEGALIQQQLDFGWYTIDGDTSFLGRAAKTLTDTGKGYRDTDSTTTIVADAATLFPLQRRTAGSAHVVTGDGRKVTQTFDQLEKVTTFETLSPGSVSLKLSSAATRSAKARARAAARRKAAARRAAARRKAAARKARAHR